MRREDSSESLSREPQLRDIVGQNLVKGRLLLFEGSQGAIFRGAATAMGGVGHGGGGPRLKQSAGTRDVLVDRRGGRGGRGRRNYAKR